MQLSQYQIEVMRVASSEEYESGSIFTGSFGHRSKPVEGKNTEEIMPGVHKKVPFKGPHKIKRYHITKISINKRITAVPY